MRIGHVSDTHFGTERPEVVASLLPVLEQLRPDVMVVSGDITQRAFERQFQAARRFVDALPRAAHRIVIPGNHDLPAWNVWRRFTAPYASYERLFGPRESLWQADGIAIVTIDATNPWRQKDGYLPPARLGKRLREAREACGAKGVLILVAHQPLWTAWGEDKRQTLIDRAETARILAEAHADILMSGHVHVPFIGSTASSDPGLEWRFVLCGAGTAVSHRTRPSAPNSFNLLELEPPKLRVVRWDWDGASFREKEAFTFRRGENGWAA